MILKVSIYFINGALLILKYFLVDDTVIDPSGLSDTSQKKVLKSPAKKAKIDQESIGSNGHDNALAKSVEIREKWFASQNEVTSPVTSNTNKRFVFGISLFV